MIIMNKNISIITEVAAFGMCDKLLKQISAIYAEKTEKEKSEELDKLFMEFGKYEEIITRISDSREQSDEKRLYEYFNYMERLKHMIRLKAPNIIILNEHEFAMRKIFPPKDDSMFRKFETFELDEVAGTILIESIRTNDPELMKTFINNYKTEFSAEKLREKAEKYMHFKYNQEVAQVLLDEGIIDKHEYDYLLSVGIIPAYNKSPENEVREVYYRTKAIKETMSGNFDVALECCKKYNYYACTIDSLDVEYGYKELVCLITIDAVIRNDTNMLIDFLQMIEYNDRFDKDDVHYELHEEYEQFWNDENDSTTIEAIIKAWDDAHGYTYEEE